MKTLLEHRKIAYTTVMTMMNILEQKGYLKKRQDDRAFVYTPSRPQKQVIRSMVREFVDRVFNGSAEPLLVHLVEDQHLKEGSRRDPQDASGKDANDLALVLDNLLSWSAQVAHSGRGCSALAALRLTHPRARLIFLAGDSGGRFAVCRRSRPGSSPSAVRRRCPSAPTPLR